MDTSTWRIRVLLEPRGFIRVLEFILAIVAFATTGGFHSEMEGTVKCGETSPQTFNVPVSYPFNLESYTVDVPTCNTTATGPGDGGNITMNGNFSPTSQWFLFVGVMAFLICIASVVFYVAFEATVRPTNERLVTVADFVLSIVWTFLWLTAAASWAWGVGQVKVYTSYNEIMKLEPLKATCSTSGVACNRNNNFDYSSLNASVAFAFLSFFVWAGNVWFVYKETPFHDDQQGLTPNQETPKQEVPPANQM